MARGRESTIARKVSARQHCQPVSTRLGAVAAGEARARGEPDPRRRSAVEVEGAVAAEAAGRWAAGEELRGLEQRGTVAQRAGDDHQVLSALGVARESARGALAVVGAAAAG